MSDLKKKLIKLLNALEEEELKTVREFSEGSDDKGKQDVVKILDILEGRIFKKKPIRTLWLIASDGDKTMASISGMSTVLIKVILGSMRKDPNIKKTVLLAAKIFEDGEKGDEGFPVCDSCGERNPQTLGELLKVLNQ